jgi:aryl-alcohol dehydrogenase-like predicted oxidoreductase
MALLTTLQPLAGKIDASLAQLSLAWLLAQDESIVPIPGMKQKKYIDENLAAIDLLLPDNVTAQLNTMEVTIKGSRHNQYNLEFIDT